MPQSIRWRLALWHTLALAVVLSGFAAAVYALLAHALFQQADRTLQSAFRQLEQDPRLAADPGDRLRYWVEEFKDHENLFCVVYGPDGGVVERTRELAADSVPPPPGLPERPRTRDVALPAIGRQRVLEGRVRVGGNDHAVLLMTPLKEVDHELDELLTVLLTAGPLAAVFSGVLGYVLARQALTPVDQIRTQTEAVTAERLHHRLPVANPHDELGRLAQTINAMIGRLERSFAETRRFTADASHELRTPLTVIRTEAEVALGKPLSFADTQALLGSILEECNRLTRLTDQLLALARQDAGLVPPRRGPVRFGDLARDAAETLRSFAEAKGVALNETSGPADGAVVLGDPDLLRQVLVNLIDNAIKYTPAGGSVDVAVAADRNAVTARVQDTGEGISDEHLPHVFDRFYRVDKARSRAEGGTGLGLSIARSLVEAHGGTVELASVPGEGTMVTVTLPRAGEDA